MTFFFFFFFFRGRGVEEVERTKKRRGIGGWKKKKKQKKTPFTRRLSPYRVRVDVPHEDLALLVGDCEQRKHGVERNGLDFAARGAERRGAETHRRALFDGRESSKSRNEKKRERRQQKGNQPRFRVS